jgi:hypothetical protein
LHFFLKIGVLSKIRCNRCNNAPESLILCGFSCYTFLLHHCYTFLKGVTSAAIIFESAIPSIQFG